MEKLKRYIQMGNALIEDGSGHLVFYKDIAVLEKRVAEHEKFLALVVSGKHPLFKNRFEEE